ncbi:MAG: HlyC/CorC family transporter, partial [Lachnospiraceae bacterium]|nr:HlyC/CorC family transporter [Lachnospiraceae bacterium]
FQISFKEEEFETLNGYLISQMDKIPDEDDEGISVAVGNYEFKILTVENRMIKSVLVTKLPEKDKPAGEEKEQEKGEK